MISRAVAAGSYGRLIPILPLCSGLPALLPRQPRQRDYIVIDLSPPPPPRVDEIKEAVADHYGLRVRDLVGAQRSARFARPRQLAMWLCRELTQRTFGEIGRLFGGRDHSTVLHACNVMPGRLKTDADLQGAEAAIRAEIIRRTRERAGEGVHVGSS